MNIKNVNMLFKLFEGMNSKITYSPTIGDNPLQRSLYYDEFHVTGPNNVSSIGTVDDHNLIVYKDELIHMR
jgi:hypothetical protein